MPISTYWYPHLKLLPTDQRRNPKLLLEQKKEGDLDIFHQVPHPKCRPQSYISISCNITIEMVHLKNMLEEEQAKSYKPNIFDIIFNRSTVSIGLPNADDTCNKFAILLISLEVLLPAA